MKHDGTYIEAQRIFNKCCQALCVPLYDKTQNRMARDMAIIVADEIVRSYPCGCEYSVAETQRKKAYWLDVKYELMNYF
jgi:hypothetical protein